MQARTLNASSQQADTVLGALQVLVDAKAEYDAMDEDDIDQVVLFSFFFDYAHTQRL